MVLCVPALGLAESPSNANTSRALSKLHQANKMEVEAGSMAMAKAQAKDVKQLGQRLVTDHENADRMVRELAKQEGVRLETEAEDREHRSEMIARLKKAGPQDFDREFLDAMAEDHDKAIAFVKTQLAVSEDGRLKELLSKLLPALEQQRDITRSLLARNRD
jgi:predicted outer membrane protein